MRATSNSHIGGGHGDGLRLMATYALCCLLFSLTFTGAARGSQSERQASNRQKLAAGRDALSEEVTKLEVFDLKEKGLLRKFARLELDIERKRQEIKELDRSIASLKSRSAGLAMELKDLKRRELLLEAKLADRLVSLYKYARKGYMRALCTARDLDEFRRRAKYLGLILAEDYSQLQKIFIEKHKIGEELEKVKLEISRTDALMKAQVPQLAALKKEVDKKVIQLMRIHEEKEFYKTAARDLARAGPKFKESLVRVKDSSGSPALTLNSDISSLKGKLPVPLDGIVVKGAKLFGSNKVHLEKGIFIRGREGEEVRAILPGRIEFSGRLKGYGQVIIINHGSRFFTISALLARREKQEGDLVKQGEVIGEVGSVKNGIGPSLYFEIRKGGKNLNPLKWLKTRG